LRRFITRVTDAENNKKETFRDVRELITTVKEYNAVKGEVITTRYEYDPLKQIVKVIDNKNNITKVEYDNLGRRTVIDNRGAESFRLLSRGSGLLPGRDLTVNPEVRTVNEPAYSAGGSVMLKSDGKKKD